MIRKTGTGNVAMTINDGAWKSSEDYSSNNRIISVNSWSGSVTISNGATIKVTAGAGTRATIIGCRTNNAPSGDAGKSSHGVNARMTFAVATTTDNDSGNSASSICSRCTA